MYKSASKQNYFSSSEGFRTFTTFKNTSNQPNSPCFINKAKKTGVRFQFDENNENQSIKNTAFERQTQKNSQMVKNTLYHSAVTYNKSQNKENEFSAGTFNRSNQNKFYLQTFDRKKSHFQNFSSKKIKIAQQQLFIENDSSYGIKKSKSMKKLNFSEVREQNFEPKLQKKRSERKFQNVTAFDNLLKQTQNLVQKYKKLDNQKIRIKMDLQNQIQFKSKSSKKIGFLQQIQNQYKIQKQNIDFSNSNKSKFTDFSQQRKIFGDKNQNRIQSFALLSKNKTFSGLKSKDYLRQNNQQTNNFTFTKNQVNQKQDLNSCSYNGSFGFYKSTSKKNLLSSKLSLNDFQLGKVLGSGAFGQVFPAKHKQTGWIFALKKIKKSSVKHMLDQFIQEIKIQLFLDHPNIVKLYAFFDDELHFYILMEYMEEGSLYSYLKKKKTLSIEETSSKLVDICKGLQHMHDNSVAHRDIKPQNIVLSYNVPKLCDFGWSAILNNRRTTFCGTLDYVCPQILQGEEYDGSVDIWSLGVLAYELLVGKTPFYNISRKQTMKKIVDCNLEFPESIPRVAVDFISNILKKNPEHRQSIQEVLKEPFLKSSLNQKSFI